MTAGIQEVSYLSMVQAILFTLVFTIAACLSQTNTVESNSGSVEGRHLKIAMIREFELVSFHPAPNKNATGYAEFPLELLRWLSKRLKFTYTLVPGGYVIQPLPNGTWAGGYGLLQRKEVDFFFAPVPIASKSYHICDFTAPLFEAPLVMLVPSPEEENRIAAVIKPFSLSVWLLIIGTVICIVIAARLISHNIFHAHKQEKKLSLNFLTICNLKLIFGQGGFEGTLFKSLHMRLLLSGWLLSVLVLLNCYAGTFISRATVPIFKNEIKTVEDVAFRSNLIPLVNEVLTDMFYRESRVEPLMILAKRLLENRDVASVRVADIADRVNTGCCFLVFPEYLLDAMMFADFKKTGRCRCRITRVPIAWNSIGISAKKGSPYSTAFSKEILLAKEMGFLGIWHPESAKRSYKCTKLESPKVRPLTMTDLKSPFLFLAIGVLLSVAAFILEKIAANVKKIKSNKK